MKTGFRGLHPAAAFLFFAVAFTISMTATHPLLLGGCLAAGAVYAVCLRKKNAVRFLLRLLLPAAALITVFNGLCCHYGVTVLFYLRNGNRVTLEALTFGGIFALRITGMLLWLDCLNEILTPEKIIFLFGKFTPKTALILSMALRFIPLIRTQSAEIKAAQAGSGSASFGKNPIKKCMAAAHRFSILTSWLLEKGIDTADAMHARGYGLPGRRVYTGLFFTRADAAVTGLSVLAGTVYCLLYTPLRATYNPVIAVPLPTGPQTAAVCILLLILFLPPIFDQTEKYKWKQRRSAT